MYTLYTWSNNLKIQFLAILLHRWTDVKVWRFVFERWNVNAFVSWSTDNNSITSLSSQSIFKGKQQTISRWLSPPLQVEISPRRKHCHMLKTCSYSPFNKAEQWVWGCRLDEASYLKRSRWTCDGSLFKSPSAVVHPPLRLLRSRRSICWLMRSASCSRRGRFHRRHSGLQQLHYTTLSDFLISLSRESKDTGQFFAPAV